MAQDEPNFILLGADEAPQAMDSLRRRALRLLQAAGDDEPRDDRREAMGFASPAPMSAAEAAPARALAVGFVTMPAVFLVVVMGALAMFGRPAEKQAAETAALHETLQQPASRAASDPVLASAEKTAKGIGIGEDESIGAIALDGDRLAVQVEGPSGARIVIYDFVREETIASPALDVALSAETDRLGALTGPPETPSLAVIELAADVQEPAPAAPEAALTARSDISPTTPTLKPHASE